MAVSRLLLQLDFQTGGNARPTLGDGWSFEEPFGTWSLGTRSEINLPPFSVSETCRLELQLVPFLAYPTVTRQRLELRLNGVVVLTQELTTNQLVNTIRCDVPATSLNADGPNILQLLHPNAARPSQHTEHNTDARELGIQVQTLKITIPPVRPTSRSVAIITTVYNESVNLPIWLRHYARAVPHAALFVLDHGSSDGSTANVEPANRIPLPRHEYDDATRAAFVNDMQHALLRYYDVVIYTDCDELLVPDPERHESLAAYLEQMEQPYANAIGLNLLHVPDREPAIDPLQPLLCQRRWCQFTASMCKPGTTRVALNWAVGFHACDRAPLIDPSLYLFHIKTMDVALALERQRLMRALDWSNDAIDRGFGLHQRASDADFLEAFFGDPGHRVGLGDIAAFDFTDDLTRFRAEVTVSGAIHHTPHFRGRIAEVPQAFRACF